jgi:hypothetical protein
MMAVCDGVLSESVQLQAASQVSLRMYSLLCTEAAFDAVKICLNISAV